MVKWALPGEEPFFAAALGPSDQFERFLADTLAIHSVLSSVAMNLRAKNPAEAASSLKAKPPSASSIGVLAPGVEPLKINLDTFARGNAPLGTSLRSQVAGVFGLPEAVLSGDLSAANLASLSAILKVTKGIYEGLQIFLVERFKDLFVAALSLNSVVPEVIEASSTWIEDQLVIEIPDVLADDVAVTIEALLASVQAGILPAESAQSRLVELLRLQEIDGDLPLPVEPVESEGEAPLEE